MKKLINQHAGPDKIQIITVILCIHTRSSEKGSKGIVVCRFRFEKSLRVIWFEAVNMPRNQFRSGRSGEVVYREHDSNEEDNEPVSSGDIPRGKHCAL